MEKNPGERPIYISNFDMVRLQDLLVVAKEYNVGGIKHLDELEKELLRAKIVAQNVIPSDVITMNSTIVLKGLEADRELTYTLAFPAEASLEENKVSILSPIGTALIGCRVGDIIEWQDTTGLRRLKVVNILYQPESAGDYHL